MTLERAENPVIDDADERVTLYLKNLKMLWLLGTVPWETAKPEVPEVIPRNRSDAA